ncbi:phage portal protein [Halococcus saccharolyticus]|uniref:Phage putative head morphogenesis protein, SPP1 gp7 family n=1 Tax=Halococcus saccharolyticus DSM 5350 TaxID=1227455 RepID=M0MA93_9EURY|nr:phage portal protein [Halococcus saccharolyticus]EMA42666.1 phage putative head morphogenesis protein, SPP1 gp7 family [Halococcus saccharolyticus DSM 5350]
MARNSPIQRLRDGVAKRLWSGDVVEDAGHVDDRGGQVYHRGQNEWSRTEVAVSKDDNGMRRGSVPEHIESPIKGRQRSYNPLSLRQLAQSGVVQSNMAAILGDLESVPWSVVPIDEETSVASGVIDEAERALEDPNPNPESFDDINSMLARDLLEVGNCVSVTNLQVEGRRAEAVPLDPNTFTADWDNHRILQRFYQYPRAEQRWGNPEELDREIVMWGVFQPTQTRAGIYGYSPVEMVSRFINIMGGLVDKEIRELEEGMPSGLITLIGDEWSDRDYEKFETYWENEVKGEQMKHPYTRGKADFVPFNMTYDELQVLDRQQWYAKLVASAFRTPISETGLAIGEEMTRATDVSQRQKYKKRALGAIINNLEQLWTTQYLHRWFSEDIKLQFDPGRDIMEKREIAETNKLKLESGVTTVNEIREERGLDPVEWGDKPGTPQTRSSSGSSGNDGGGLTPEGENQNSQGPGGEGLQQNQTPTNDGGDTGFSDGGQDAAAAKSYAGDEGYWLPEGAEVVSKKALRETDDYRQFSFQPGEIEALQEDVEDVYESAIDDVRRQIKGNQQLLRYPTENHQGKSPKEVAAQKNLPELMKLVKQVIGIGFAEDVRDVVVEHKVEKITDGEQSILSELRQAGLSIEDVDLDQVRDRVVERIRDRTLKITKPISQRLEDDLREVLQTAWTEGHRITTVEENIEDLSEQWTGYEAERLARDQLGKAAKEGRTEYAEATGDEVGGWARTWIDSSDHRVRPSHRDMDGVTVGPGESWTVDYTKDGGPPAVDEKFPGASVWGIMCRCDFTLAPQTTVSKVRKWAADPSRRMEEVAAEKGQSIDRVLLRAELGPESRTAAAKRLGVSKQTLYDWLHDSGLYDR